MGGAVRGKRDTGSVHCLEYWWPLSEPYVLPSESWKITGSQRLKGLAL
jgi:hypothetical protein